MLKGKKQTNVILPQFQEYHENNQSVNILVLDIPVAMIDDLLFVF